MVISIITPLKIKLLELSLVSTYRNFILNNDKYLPID